MSIYLDNAATTPMDEAVIEEMVRYMRSEFGNPSSTHAYGRRTRAAIDLARRRVANLIGADSGEIIFTSGGTEADNMAIKCAISDHGIQHAITSPIEHHAVLHPLEHLAARGDIKLSMVRVDKYGAVDLNHLEELLASHPRSFVSLMHANNEIGTLLPLAEVGALCARHQALLHSDTVQTMAHYRLNVRQLGAHFLTCAAHKFHGPKGAGFIFINRDVRISPFLEGGAQERNMRAGTENVYGIIGLAKAMEIAYAELDEHVNHIKALRSYAMSQLEAALPGLQYNGNPHGDSLYTVLNVCLPDCERKEMLLFNLDIEGIAVSGGSACSSGSNVGSHVLTAIGSPAERPSVRFSFSKYNTKADIDFTVSKLKSIYALPALV